MLLAFDWDEGAKRRDFLGFAIRRTPGFGRSASPFLPNRIDFNGAVTPDAPSDRAPIQKFMWWNARFDDPDRGRRFTYTACSVVASPTSLRLLTSAERSISVRLPKSEEHGIGKYFNRAW